MFGLAVALINSFATICEFHGADFVTTSTSVDAENAYS